MNMSVNKFFVTAELDQRVPFSFSVPPGAMLEEVVYIQLDDDIDLNELAQQVVSLLLEGESELVAIEEGYSMADIIIIDNDGELCTI